jgi:membrane-bound lytic murein transglycosylase C
MALLCALLTGCSVQQVARIVSAGDPAEAVRDVARERRAAYERDPRQVVRDTRVLREQLQIVVAALRTEVRRRWGEDEVRVPSEREYVKYTDNYMSRALVDFDAGLVTVETLDQDAPQRSLHSAIVTTLLTPDDPRAVDLFTAGTVELAGSPYLQGLVLDHQGQPIAEARRAQAFAEHLLRQEARDRTVQTPDGPRRVLYVRIAMVPNHLHQRALRYASQVDRHSRRFGVSPSLVYAVMEIESAFNPFAVSPAPAYGLMQLVPTTGGRDAHRHAHGVDVIPSKEFLFEPANNIELGTAYLNMLDFHYLAGIEHPDAREYAVIAAYNGGASRVLALFDRDPARAVAAINAMHPSEVYRTITTRHPAAETRAYLAKVIQARRAYVNI